MLLHVAVGHTETLKRSWSDGQTNFGWHVAVKRESPRFICGECQSISVYPTAPLDGTLQAWLAKFAGPTGKNAGQLNAPLKLAPAGDKAISASGGYNAPGGGTLGAIFSAFSLDGETVVATRTLFSDAALLPRYQSKARL